METPKIKRIGMVNVQLVHQLQFFLDSVKEVQQLETVSGIELLYFGNYSRTTHHNKMVAACFAFEEGIIDLSEHTNLRFLDIMGWSITGINTIPRYLCTLFVRRSNNNPEEFHLPVCLPNTLRRLRLQNMIIPRPHELSLPRDLVELTMYRMKLTRLPKLPPRLRELWVEDNQLEELPELPDTLQRLIVNKNKLTRLPKLPESLECLWCSDNLLEELGPFPEKLRYLNCSRNRLTRLENVPDGVETLRFKGNPIVDPSMLD